MDRKTTTTTVSKLNYKQKTPVKAVTHLQVRDPQNWTVSTDVVFIRNKQTFTTAFSALQENRINDRQLIVIKQYHKKTPR